MIHHKGKQIDESSNINVVERVTNIKEIFNLIVNPIHIV